MLVLGIDSSTEVGTASLFGESKLIGEKLLNLEQTHSQRLMPQIVNLIESCGFKPADITGIGITKGPGSFTGTRIGMATGKALAHSLEVPIVGISTLEVLAYNLRFGRHYVCPMIDARGGRVFSCLYRADDGLNREIKEALMEPKELVTQLETIEETIYFAGEVVASYQTAIEAKITSPKFVTSLFNIPRAGAVVELAAKRLKEGVEDDLFSLTPCYLKRSQAEIQWEQR